MRREGARPGITSRILRRSVAERFLILLLPTALALVFYRQSAVAVERRVDELASFQLEAGLASVDSVFVELRRAAARFASDYDINMYLNEAGPLDGIETYNLKRVSDKIAPLVHGNELMGRCFLYFARSGMVAYESGFSGYDAFYGPLFSVKGMDREAWRAAMAASAGGETALTGLEASFSGTAVPATAMIWPLGYGEQNRGAFVGVIDERVLARPLERFASDYRGWVVVLGPDGDPVSRAGGVPIPEGVAFLDLASGPGRIRSGGARYRVYRRESAVSGWSFVAGLDESVVLAGARKLRDTALLLLAASLALGTAASYAMARSQARPIGRLLSLLVGGADRSPGPTRSVYQRAEEAVLALSDSRDRFKVEAVEAERIARDYFLRRLIEGEFREREAFEAEASRFGMELGGEPRYAMVCKMSAPRGEPVARGAGAWECPSAAALGAGLGEGEYAVDLSLGEAVLVLKDDGDRRGKVRRIADGVRAAVAPESRAGLAFAAGEPAADPFLVQASYLQAIAALERASGGTDPAFYADLSGSREGLRFALDEEESIVRAVRSANGALLDSLVASTLRENFEERVLPRAEAADLAAGFRLAALRLSAEFPEEAASLRKRLYEGGSPAEPRASVEATAATLREMAALAEKRKRSHNRILASEVRSFIEARFGSRDLGLSMVAEAHRLSENYLSNLYKEQEGECVSETIEKVRIREAMRLLEGGAASIDGVAASCGYTGGASFRRAFKRVAGLSPSDYRRSRARAAEEDGL